LSDEETENLDREMGKNAEAWRTDAEEGCRVSLWEGVTRELAQIRLRELRKYAPQFVRPVLWQFGGALRLSHVDPRRYAAVFEACDFLVWTGIVNKSNRGIANDLRKHVSLGPRPIEKGWR
jgi:hypothetical protein